MREKFDILSSCLRRNSQVKEHNPGPTCVNDEDVKNFIKRTMGTTFREWPRHVLASRIERLASPRSDTSSTASMLPRKWNGVVDPELRVYGTRNLRVAELSIIPLHVAAHTQCASAQPWFGMNDVLTVRFAALAYAIGEQGEVHTLPNDTEDLTQLFSCGYLERQDLSCDGCEI